MLGVGDLAGVEPRVDPDDRFPLPSEGPGLCLGQPAGLGQPRADRAQAVELPQVLLVGQIDEQERPTPDRPADLLHEDPVARGVQAPEVVLHLPVVGETVVRARLEAEDRGWVWRTFPAPLE